MRQRITLLLRYYLFWIVLFAVQKPVFLLFHRNQAADVSFGELLGVVLHGLPLDFSTAGYLTALPGLLLTASVWIGNKTVKRMLTPYTGIMLGIAALVFAADMELYSFWGFRIDKTVFFYLDSPKDAAASLTFGTVAAGILLLAAYWTAGWWLYKKTIARHTAALPPKPRITTAPVLFLLTALLFIPIRGGFSVSTMNVGKVYFSDNMFLNHAAINPVFNLVESLSGSDVDLSRYTYMKRERALELFRNMMPPTHKGIPNGKDLPDTPFSASADTTGNDSPAPADSAIAVPYLTTARPNVILIILESFSAAVTEALSGETGAAPNLDRYCREGLLFTDMYASSFRTDRGVVAILSGYPGQPTSSIMKLPAKSQTLPSLSKTLKEAGYDLKFYYGGDENFTNMRSYLVSAGFDRRVSDQDFPLSERASKWGAHDHLVFRKALDELNGETPRPFLKTILTLSSHEPFEVPASRKFEDPYLNSVAYTDSCLGAFIEEFRKSPLWDSTLIVLTPDHGMKWPAELPNHVPARYRIPVLWLGGALSRTGQFDKTASQIDIVPTLLAQMELPIDSFRFGKNILASDYDEPFAFYSFVDGFGYITPGGSAVWDCQADRLMLREGSIDETDIEKGKAFLQLLEEDLAGR